MVAVKKVFVGGYVFGSQVEEVKGFLLPLGDPVFLGLAGKLTMVRGDGGGVVVVDKPAFGGRTVEPIKSIVGI